MTFRLSKYVIKEIDENSVLLLSLISGKGLKVKPLVYDLILADELDILPHELLNKLIVDKIIVNYNDIENIDLLSVNNLVSQDGLSISKTFFVGLSQEDEIYYDSYSLANFQNKIKYFLEVNSSSMSSFLFLINNKSNVTYAKLIKSIIPKEISKQYSYVFCYSDCKELYTIDTDFFDEGKHLYFVFNCIETESIILSFLNLISLFEGNVHAYNAGLSITVFCNFDIENLDNLVIIQLLNKFYNLFKHNISCSIYFKDIYNGSKKSILLSKKLKEFNVKTVTLPERKYSFINSYNPDVLKNDCFNIKEVDTSDTWDINDIFIDDNSLTVLRKKFNEKYIEIIENNHCFNCNFLPICGGNNKEELLKINDCPQYTFNLQHTVKQLF